MKCPRCESEQIVKNGRIHNGKQNYRCRNCGRQFVEQPKWRAISKETKKRIDKLMLEKLPLAGIARVEGVSETWLQSYVNQKYQQVEQQVTVREKKGL
jgi:insertion element IS1 protein InsB